MLQDHNYNYNKAEMHLLLISDLLRGDSTYFAEYAICSTIK